MDTALVCSLVGWNNAKVAQNGAMSGQLFETFVVAEIFKSYYNAGIDTSCLYYYRDRDKKEIDMLIENNGILYPVEIKQSARPATSMAKSFPTLKQTGSLQVGSGAIICMAEKCVAAKENLFVVPVSMI